VALDHAAGLASAQLPIAQELVDMEDASDLTRREELGRKDGLSGEVLFPSGALLYSIRDASVRRACLDRYNDVVQQVNGSSTFFRGIHQLDIDPSIARQQLQALDVDKTVGILVPLYFQDSLYSRGNYDPVFEVIEDYGIPVHMHAGEFGCPRYMTSDMGRPG